MPVGEDRKTILLVEDEEEQYSILVKTFQEHGYRAVVATTAEKALAMLDEFLPNLLIVDIKLDKMDGLTFFQELKLRGVIGKVPFVFLTAYNSLKMAMDAKQLGATDYIVKPYDLDSLVDSIDAILLPSKA